MHKGLTLERMRDFMSSAKKAKILVHGCIVIGNPGETESTIKESIDFARELDCDSMQFYPLYVYPGTEAYEQALDSDRLTTRDFSLWVNGEGYHNCVVSLPGLPPQELVGICDRAYKSYHLRPGYLAKKMRQALRHPSEGRRTIKSGLAYLKSLHRINPKKIERE